MQDEKPGKVIQPNSQPETNWQFNSDSKAGQDNSSFNAPYPAANPGHQADYINVNWSASEFISHDKSSGWYVLLALGAAAVAILLYLITRDKVSSVVVIIVAITFGVMAARKPRELSYAVDDKGIQVGEKLYPYSRFRSFAIVQEGNIDSIWLMPLKRFNPPLTVYFDPKDGQKIVDVLGEYLPIENRELDAVDRLMHRLRF